MENKRYLIVEGDPKEQKHLEELCRTAGVEYTSVNSPEEAELYIERLTSDDCVLIDVDPPNENAVELCKNIYKHCKDTFIVGLRSPENYVDHIYNALLFKPLYRFVLNMIFDKTAMG